MRPRSDFISGNAFLAIWSDVPANRETDYLHWLTREHVFERLSVEGFTGVRVYRSFRSDICRYFILYRLTSSDVLTSEAYLQRLNDPTPWSRRIMPILGDFIRGGGRVLAESGGGEGGVIAAIRLDPRAVGLDRDGLDRMAGLDRIVSVRLMETDLEGTAVQTREKNLRAQDQAFPGLLLIEGLDRPAVEAAVLHCSQSVDELYTGVFQL